MPCSNDVGGNCQTSASATGKTKQRPGSRDDNLGHLPHEELLIEPGEHDCPCCGGELRVIGEDTSKRLDEVPAR